MKMGFMRVTDESVTITNPRKTNMRVMDESVTITNPR